MLPLEFGQTELDGNLERLLGMCGLLIFQRGFKTKQEAHLPGCQTASKTFEPQIQPIFIKMLWLKTFIKFFTISFYNTNGMELIS